MQVQELVSIVIPTFRRGKVLVNTVELLLELSYLPNEILIIDQTDLHDETTQLQLNRWTKEGKIKLYRLKTPSIPAAMNRGLIEARNPVVLFLDDDIWPHKSLLLEHATAHAGAPALWATVGQVLQPGQSAELLVPPRILNGLERDFDFPFHSSADFEVENVMAGNLCVKRDLALSIGGFDENFTGSAYRFETDFARRVIAAGGRIRFLGRAGVNHLRAPSGGTRTGGSHLTSASPAHGMGDYYYAFRHGRGAEAWSYSLRRMFREVRTRYHLTHPWWIPVKFIAEIQALRLGRKLARQAPQLLATAESA